MIKKVVVLFILIVMLSITIVSALGISPSRRVYNFQPSLEKTISYRVFAAEGQKVEIFAEGELEQYIEFDKESIIGPGEFTATLKLPNDIEKPGQNRLLVGAREFMDDEVGGLIGTRIIVYSIVDIYVPYPGKYLELVFTGHNVNVGEPVDFLLDITSRGDQDVSVMPKIEIHSSEGKIENLLFKSRVIASQENIQLKKQLDTSNYNPGIYKAIAILDYGGIEIKEVDFRIGDLVIDIVNYTKEVFIEKLSAFDVQIESGWNNQIDGAYAEIYFFNSTNIFDTFKTTTTTLVPWERKTIKGYFDSENFTEGTYNANITVIYFGKEVGKSTSEIVEVEFIKSKPMLLWYIVGGIGLLILIVLGAIKLFKKNGKNKKKSKK